MGVIKKPYEISVWEDKILYVGTNGNIYNDISEMSVPVDYLYYTEDRLAVIGSDTMTSPTRVLEPVLTRNINGIETLKFDMYYQYIDPNTGKRVHNPLIDLLVNERKIKLYYNDDDPNHPDHWYDFIIKKDEEKARDNKYSFTCNSLAAHELGKTGFKIEFDTELENNMGTVLELGEKVLLDSDWQLAAREQQDTIQLTINEPLYKIFTNQSITARYTKDDTLTITIPSNKYIYVYYTPYAQQETEYFQFIYIDDNATITTLTDGITLVCKDLENGIYDLYLTNVEWVDDKPSFEYIGYYLTVVNEAVFNNNPTNYYIYDQETLEYIQCTYDSTYNSEETYYIKGDVAIAPYRGDRYVRKLKTTYNPILEQTVKIYEDQDGNEVHGYETTRYLDVTSVNNYIHNSTNFGGTSYWTAYGKGSVLSSIEKVIYPAITSENVADGRKNYLSVIIGNTWEEDGKTLLARVLNDGIIYNYSKIKTFDKNDIYILRMKVKGYNKLNNTLSEYLTTGENFPFTCQVRKYVKIDEYADDDKRYFNFLGRNAITDPDDSDYAFITAECAYPASWEDLKENLGIYFFRSGVYGGYDSYYIEDVQLYQAIPNGEGGYLKIGDKPQVDYITVEYYYYPSENLGKTKADEYVYISELYELITLTSQTYEPNKYYIKTYENNSEIVKYEISSGDFNLNTIYYKKIEFIPVYGSEDSKFEKVRSITKKESNRFNLLQELCETFECWVKFNITHESNGLINIEDYTYYNPVTECPNLIKSEYYNEAPWDNAIIDTEEYKGKKAIIIQAKTLYQETDRGTTCIFPSITFEENTQYTISLDWCDHIRTDGNSTRIRIKFDYTDGTSNNIVSPNNSSTADWVHEIFTSTAGKTVSAITTTYGSSGVVSISNFKIEKGINEINYYYYNHLTNLYILTTDNLNNIQYYEALTRKRQNKKVTFYGEILEDNPIGFKYGINLKDVTRTLDSDLIATKIIVKNNSCERAQNGFCSIARAKDNPTKENILYNFDYYINKGLLDKSSVYNDLYLEINGSIGLYPKLARYNSERNELISKSAELANSITNLTSAVLVANLTYNAAAELLSKITDPVSGKLIKYTGYIYDDFLNLVARANSTNNNRIPLYINQIYYIKDGTNLTGVKIYNPSETNLNVYFKEIEFKEVTTLQEIDTLISDLTTANALKYYWKDRSNYLRCRAGDTYDNTKTYYNLGESNKRPYYIKTGENKFTWLDNTYSMLYGSTTYYWRYEGSLAGHGYVEVENLTENEFNLNKSKYYYKENNEYILCTEETTFSDIQYYTKEEIYFQINDEDAKQLFFTYTDNTSIPEVYIYGAYKRTAQAADDDTVNDNSAINYIAQIDTLTKDKEKAEENYNTFNLDLTTKTDEYNEIKARLEDIARITEEIEKEFIFKYSRFIQEGSWNDDNYMDDDLYYLDAVNVLYQSAYPKTSYTVSVLELSALEGYETYKFLIAHKTFIEDTEFFGWSDYALHVPARESIVVTELTNNLDSCEKNTIKVLNYKSHFEDLFQRITAATQNLEYHSGDYSRASDAVQNNGTLAQSVLQKSIATAAYIISNANNQSVVLDDTGLKATKVNDPAQVAKLTSSGLMISNDGGKTWSVAISGYGIATDLLTAGIIDADNINIMNGAYPTFKWDANGLRALAFSLLNNEITSYNTAQYVVYDRFGLYGINGILNFIPLNVTDVEKNSSFALTWNGLFIRSNYRDGYVSISPNDDITLYGYNNEKFILYDKTSPEFDYYYYEVNKDLFYLNRNGIYEKCTTESYYDVLDKNLYQINNNGEISVTPIKRAKFGMLYKDHNNKEIYGIALYNENGLSTLTTLSDGTLWLQDSMRIGTSNQSNTIYIGVGSVDTTPGQNRYKVINVNDLNNNEKFIVYSDGTLSASGVNIEGTIHAIDGEFTGTIYATSGKIGNNIIGNDGITIINSGGFRIKNNSDDENCLFEVTESGIEMTGIIHATGGEFNSGIIGGFIIGSHSITSEGLELWSSYKNENNETIPSKIIANNIDLGVGANITNYLNIGNLRLLNPTVGSNNNEVLTLSDNGTNYFTLFDNGNILGENWSIKKDDYYSYIKISDEEPPSDFDTNYSEYYYYNEENNSYIQCTSSDNDKAPYYTKKKLVTAKFDRGIFTGTINAEDGVFSGAITAATINATTINTINFVTEKVRSMGGAFIFKPTFECEIVNINGLNITVELNNIDDFNQFLSNDVVSFTDSKVQNGIIVGLVNNRDETNIRITVITDAIISSDFNPSTITRFGLSNTDIIIAINSDESDVGNLLKPKSLTISDFNYSNKLDTNIKLLLGDLKGAKDASKNNLTGYGLYADNVYLHGSLVTEIPSNSNDLTYAGVNTIPTITSEKFSGEKIVFWAGAENYTEANSSPFYVTDKGSIYASKGEFSGTVIANSIISKSTIEAAIIKGNGTSPSLKIYDTNNNNGISFYRDEYIDNNIVYPEKETLRITNNGIIHFYNNTSSNIITFSENSSNIDIQNNNTHYLDGKILYSTNDIIKFDNNIELNKNSEYQYIKITNDNVQLKHSAIINDGEVIFSNTITDNNNVSITYKLDYKVNNGYYCLYVS